MKSFLHTLAIVGFGSALLVGCNETTRDDVTAARQRIDTEKRRLEDVKREEARKIDEEKREAEQARVTNKPIVGDDFNEGPAEEAREAERARKAAQDRIQRQREQVDDAARTADDKEARLVQEQARDKFLIDCKAAIDMADRAVEKLQTEKNAADEPGKQTLDHRINTIKAKRDALQTKINDIRSADVMRWSDHKAIAQKAMDELNREVSTVS
jgi:hypothetical protein